MKLKTQLPELYPEEKSGQDTRVGLSPYSGRIKKIYDGFMPEKPKDAPCEFCSFTGMCDVKSTLASRFF
jgi:hypothetical protein